MVEPHLKALHKGEITQIALAEKLGVNRNTFASFMRRRMTAARVGQGGVYKASDEMLQALEEATPPLVSIAKVARKYGVDYLALARRVKARRDKLAKLINQPETQE
jgi:predicted DNA-binding protein (UPF0251 family)